jgi:ferredoxin
MKTYQVRLMNPQRKLDETITVGEDEYILEIAEANGIRLPSGCKQGDCSSCVARLIKGTINQNNQKFLQAGEVNAGYVVTCISSPMSDCTLVTHQEQVLFDTALYHQRQENL